MQTLIFNTTTKTVILFEGSANVTKVLQKLSDIPTVKISDRFYEVVQKDQSDKVFPVLRVPICNTNMIIER